MARVIMIHTNDLSKLLSTDLLKDVMIAESLAIMLIEDFAIAARLAFI